MKRVAAALLLSLVLVSCGDTGAGTDFTSGGLRQECEAAGGNFLYTFSGSDQCYFPNPPLSGGG